MLFVALVAAACGGDDGAADDTAVPTTEAADTTAPGEEATTAVPGEETTTAAPAGPQSGGEAVIGQDQEPPTLNPYAPGGDNFTVGITGQGYHTGVYEVDGFTLELIPEVVTELPTLENGGVVVNDDGTLTVTYTIRDEAQWSDGTPISGDDFQFTLDTILDPDLPTNKAVYEDIVDTEVGPKTFTYTLSVPTVQYELLFSHVGTQPLLPKHAVEGSDFVNDWNQTMWPSAGPFVFSEWQPGEFITMTRNENYWKTDENGNQLPYLDSVTIRFIPETEAMVNAFRAREIDIVNPPPSAELIETLQALEPEGAAVEALSGAIWEHLAFSFAPTATERNPDSPNASLNYRTCVAHLVNKQLIVDEILAGQVEPLDSFVDPYYPSLSQQAWAKYDYNLETAQGFCDAAREELGVDTLTAVFTTTSNNDARVLLSELFVDMFGAVGIEYENQLEDSQLFFGETTINGNFDLGEWAWVGTPGFAGLVSGMDLWDPEQPPPDGQNYYQWGTPGSSLINEATERFAVIRDELNSTVDPAVLEPLINEAEQLLADELVFIPLYQRLDPMAVWADELGGAKHNTSQAGFTWNIEDWYRADM